MFVYYLENNFTKSDVNFCFMQASFFFAARELHPRWKLERLDLWVGKSGVEFPASMN